jgi:GPH family glycoside/pentoside/hexuronide:cation symporter
MANVTAVGSFKAMRESEAQAGQGLSVPLCLSFGVGTLGTAILLNTVTTFFPTLMATVLGRSTALAGLLLTVSKLYDIAADLAIGAASDRTRTKWGRRRPYLLAGAAVSAVSFLMLFAPPHLGPAALVAYMALALVVYSTGYSLFNVPYNAMPAEMTQGYHERTRLLSYRTFFAAVGQMAALGLAAWLIQKGGGGARGYGVMGAAMAAIVGATTLITFFGTASANRIEPWSGPRIGFGKAVVMLASNRPLVLLMGTKFLQFLALASATGGGLLFRLNVLKTGMNGQIELAVAQNVVTALSMPVWVWMGRRWGKKWTYILAIAIFGAGCMSWLWSGPGITLASMLIRAAVLGFGAGGMLLMSISMLPDVMEEDRRRTGMRREGVYSSLYAIVEKVGYAVGPALVGIYITASGYIPTTHGRIIVQPHTAVTALYMANSVVPAVLLLGSILMIWGYNIDERTLSGPVLTTPEENPEAALS